MCALLLVVVLLAQGVVPAAEPPGNTRDATAVAACHDLELAARTGQEFNPGTLIGEIVARMRGVMSEVERLRAA